MPREHTAYTFKFEVEVILHSLEHREHPEADIKQLKLPIVNKKVREHIEEAVHRWGGQFFPDDVLFSANVYAVRVKNKPSHVPGKTLIKPQRPRARTGMKKGTRLKKANDVNSRQRKDSI